MTKAIWACFAIGLAATATGAEAYTYSGYKQLTATAACADTVNVVVPRDQGADGVAIHFRGGLRLPGASPAVVLSVKDTGPLGQNSVAQIDFLLKYDGAMSRRLNATIRRHIQRADQLQTVDYQISEPLAANATRTPKGDLFETSVDMWFYIFEDTIWIESNEGLSPLGARKNAVVYSGFSPKTSYKYQIKRASGCGDSASKSTGYDVYILSYEQFRADADAKYSKIAVAPYLNNGDRRTAVAFEDNGR